MARTPDDIIKTIIGEQVIQIAVLTARVEALMEQLPKPGPIPGPIDPADKEQVNG